MTAAVVSVIVGSERCCACYKTSYQDGSFPDRTEGEEA